MMVEDSHAQQQVVPRTEEVPETVKKRTPIVRLEFGVSPDHDLPDRKPPKGPTGLPSRG